MDNSLFNSNSLGKLEKISIHDTVDYAFIPENKDEFCYGKVKEVIAESKPQIMGFGGIASSYGWAKVLSNRIKKDFPTL